jgi:O-antigen ligase
VPLAYNPGSRWEYEPDKAALALALTGMLLGVSLWRGGVPLGAPSPLAPLLVAYLLVRWLTLARSPVPHWSLWGDPAWRNGWWLALACAALFLLARGQLRGERRARAVDALLVGSAFVAGYGLLQYAGFDPLSDHGWVRVPSTLAHPNLLAAYLAMVMPLAAARALTAPSLRERAWVALLLLVQALCLLFTYSRAGWLAAATGLGALSLCRLWLRDRRRLALALLLAALAALAVLMVLSLLPPLPGTAPHALQTLTSLFRREGATVQIRLLAWRAGLEALAERPWLGYGPATYRALLPRFLPPELAPFGGAGALGGRPHNVYLEVALESGSVGLVAYGALLVALLAPPVRAILRPPAPLSRTDGAYLAAALGALGADLVTGLFSFECVATALLFWTLAGAAHAVVAPSRARAAPHPAGGALVALGSLVLAAWTIIPDVVAYAGETLVTQGEGRAGLEALAWAGRWGPTPELFWAVEGEACAHWAARWEDGATWRRGARLHARLVAAHPRDVERWRRQGLYLRRWYLADPHPARGEGALAAYTQALHLSPRDPDLWLDRGLLWLDMGKPERAWADIERAGALLEGYARYYGARSLHALAVGDGAGAAAWQKQAREARRAWEAWSWRR